MNLLSSCAAGVFVCSAVTVLRAQDAPVLSSYEFALGHEAAVEHAVAIEGNSSGYVSLTARSVPLAVVLAALGRECDLWVVADAALAEPVDITLREKPLPEVLARLLRRYSFVLVYDGSMCGPTAEAGRVRAAQRRTGTSNSLHVYASQADTAARVLHEPVPGFARAQQGEPGEVDAIGRIDAVSLTHRADAASLASELAAMLTVDADAAVREEAVHALGRIDTAISLDALVQALGDVSPHVREAAVYAIAEWIDRADTNDPGGRSALQVALADADAGVREAAASVLEAPR